MIILVDNYGITIEEVTYSDILDSIVSDKRLCSADENMTCAECVANYSSTIGTFDMCDLICRTRRNHTGAVSKDLVIKTSQQLHYILKDFDKIVADDKHVLAEYVTPWGITLLEMCEILHEQINKIRYTFKYESNKEKYNHTR